MEIKVFANFRDICGGKIVSIEASEGQPISLLLDQLIHRYPKMNDELFNEAKELKPHIHVFINGKNIIHLDGLTTSLKLSDEVSLFPPVAGG